MATRPTSVKDYLDSLPADRREAVEAIRKVIRANIDPAFEEGIQYGMIGYYLPHSVYPAGYHCDPKQPLPFASIASQKKHIGIYMFCIYGNDGETERFQKEWLASGKKLDMGKGCVRVKSLADTPLAVVGRAFKRMSAKKFLAHYESVIDTRGAKRATAKKKSSTKKAPAKKTAAAKKTAKKAVAKKAVVKKPAAKKKTAKKAARRS